MATFSVNLVVILSFIQSAARDAKFYKFLSGKLQFYYESNDGWSEIQKIRKIIRITNNKVCFPTAESQGRRLRFENREYYDFLWRIWIGCDWGTRNMKILNRIVHLEDNTYIYLQATNLLAVRQKRRIYDITNVLEGIGLIEKKSKNSIQWKWVFRSAS